GGALKTLVNDALVQSAIKNAKPGALVAVVREHQPAGFANDSGYDLVLYINLTSVTLASPAAGIALGTAKSFEPLLGTGGVFVNATFGGTGRPNAITGLAAGAIWATLVPS